VCTQDKRRRCRAQRGVRGSRFGYFGAHHNELIDQADVINATTAADSKRAIASGILLGTHARPRVDIDTLIG
jgi:hypothetical protein